MKLALKIIFVVLLSIVCILGLLAYRTTHVLNIINDVSIDYEEARLVEVLDGSFLINYKKISNDKNVLEVDEKLESIYVVESKLLLSYVKCNIYIENGLTSGHIC